MMVRDLDPLLYAINPGRILGLDYGKRRIGIALSDPNQLLGTPLTTFPNKGFFDICARIEKSCADHEVVAVVLGHPVHMDGRLSETAMQVRHLKNDLEKILDIPIILWDERWSTVSAHKTLLTTGRSPSKNRKIVDQIAAAHILQSFLDRLFQIKNRNKNLSE